MLDEGAAAGFDALGYDYRTVAYVERDSFAASVIVARMEGEALAPAPVWDDLTTFPGRAFRGVVDCVTAGFPCQDLSVAGTRAGLGGKRSGLFFNCLDIADDCGASLVLLENVAGIATAGASLVDEAFGQLTERAAARVLGELADRRWAAEWLHLRASAVGAAHGRDRWFCLAWRLANSNGGRSNSRRRDDAEMRRFSEAQRQSEHGSSLSRRGRRSRDGDVADPASINGFERQRLREPPTIEAGSESWLEGSGDEMANADAMGTEREPRVVRGKTPAREGAADQRERDGSSARHGGNDVGDADSIGRWQQGDGDGESGIDPAGSRMADAREPRLPSAEQPGQPGQPKRGYADAGSATTELRGASLFAPGPGDSRWPEIIARHPNLAPAIEPGLRVLADGVAYVVDESRADQLRCGGNGVVALQAAVAVVELGRRAGLG